MVALRCLKGVYGVFWLDPLCCRGVYVWLQLKQVFRALYQQHAPRIYVTFAIYEGTGSGT